MVNYKDRSRYSFFQKIDFLLKGLVQHMRMVRNY